MSDNLDLSLSLNLPLSALHFDKLSLRHAPPPFIPPPAFASKNLSSDKVVAGCSDESTIAHRSGFPLPPSRKNVRNGAGNVGSKISGNASILLPKQEDVVGKFTLGPSSYMGATRISKPKSLKTAKSVAQVAKLEADSKFNFNGCRYDSSLGLLTKKFIKLIQEAKDGTLDLNRTADILQVQKRRIYDITNVLEGIGLIEKTAKNHIRWKGFGPKEREVEAFHLKAEVACLHAEDQALDNRIRDKLEDIRRLTSNPDFQKNLFLTEEDIMSLPQLRNQTVFAIQAPRASFLEVPDPDEDLVFCQQQHKLTVRSTTGPISVYLLSKKEQKSRDISAKRCKLMDSMGWTSSSAVDEADLASSPDTSASAKSYGFQKIVPIDAGIDYDYWLRSDHTASVSDLWS